MKVFRDINVYRGHIMTMNTLCSIRHTIDTSDTFYEAENDYWDETSPRIQEFETDFFRTVIECPFRNELDIPETFFKLGEFSLKSFSPEIIEDLQEIKDRIAELSDELDEDLLEDAEGELDIVIDKIGDVIEKHGWKVR